MASDDPNYNSLHQANIGCFGLFECIDDRNVAAALFEAAAGWLRKKGRDEVMGPIDYSTNYVCGLLIDGFQFAPTILTAHNPPYYRELIEGTDWDAYGRGKDDRCANCMAHCGYEPSAVFATVGSLRESLRAATSL